jgi:hypothetical protein
MTKQTTKTDNLPAGFKDISKRVRSTMAGRYTQYTDDNSGECTVNFNEAQTKAISYILSHVVKQNGAFLTCFANNKPILDNDLETTIDACAMHTEALKRPYIRHVLTSAPMSFQRYQYCPGFPQFLKVDGATTYNTWHENPRLEVTDASFQKWLSSKEEAKEWACRELDTGGSKQDAYGLFQVASEPQIMRVMLRMLFGNENSPVTTDTWEEDGEILTRWLACCVHRPLERIRWAPVLRGVHGVGKGTFQYFAKALMGRGSVNVVNNLKGITGQFNGAMALTRLLVVDECYSKSGMAMETFKPIVSEDYVDVERKGEALFQTRATHNTIVFSNYHVPFKSEETERRWWVPSYRHYDMGSDDKGTNQEHHVWGNRLIRKALPLDGRGDQRQLVDLLHWLKLVADNTPKSFFTKAPKSVGFVDLLDVEVGQAQDRFMDWLDGLKPQDAFTLANVVGESGIAQSEMKKVLEKRGFRSCQWKQHGNRKHWTKAPNGVAPNELVEYQAA